MRRSTVFLVMLIAMLWQSVALARTGSTALASADPAHAALHWQEQGHHHHDDGSYHLDESAESVQHLLGDHVSASVALLVEVTHDSSPPASTAPVGLTDTLAPEPTLDDLLRPPRLNS